MNRSLHRILSIAKNAFREAVRDRVLYNLVLFMLLIVASAMLLGDLTDGEQDRTIVNIGLTAMLFFGTFIAIFVGVGLVSKEIEKRTVFAVFAKPVARWEFLIGKYLGLCLTLLVNVAIMGAGISIALFFAEGAALAGTIWGSIFLIYLELIIITAVAILFSSFSSPSLSALLTFLVFIIGHMSTSLLELARGLSSQTAEIVFGVLYYVLPNLAHFSFRTEAANGLVPSSAMVGGGIAYALVYVAILLLIAISVFSRRNFK
jgi:ABC-type transport system involved in multi-copper enzyme maturation permease subunit